MAIALGKRKRRAEDPPPRTKPAPKVDESESDGEDMRAIFQRAFEAKFKSLDGAAKKKKEKPAAVETAVDEEEEDLRDGEEDDDDDDDDDDDSQGDDWAGISDAEAEPEDEIEVIEHADVRRVPRDELDKRQMKAFMSAKPPSDLASTSTKPLPTKAKDDASAADDGTDAANLKNDLALQRLLNESHLLDSSFSSTDPSGKNRHKATDLRLLSLGSKGSILEQKSMPLSHRKGIVAKKEQREFDRRREAKENGIILERAKMGKKGASDRPEKRTRGIAGPSVGRFSGATLRLSKSDVAGISGPKESRGAKGGRGRGGKGGRGGRGGKRQ